MCFSLFAGCAKDTGNDDGKETETAAKEEVKIDPKKDPHGAVIAAFEKVMSNYCGGISDVAEVLEKASQGTAQYDFGFGYGEIDASYNCVADYKTQTLSGKLSFGYDNISTSADIWYCDDLVLKAPAILGEQAYGVKLSTLKDDLNKSPLILDGLGYASADEFFEEIEDEMGMNINDIIAYFEKMSDPAKSEDFLNKIASEMEKAFDGVDAKLTEEKETNKITLTFTEKNLKAFMNAYVDLIGEYYSDIFEMAGQDFDSIMDDMEESLEDMEEVSAPVDFFLDKKTGELLSIEFDREEKDDTYSDKASLEISFEKDKIVYTAKNVTSDEDNASSSNDSTLTFTKVNKGFTVSLLTKGEYKDLEDSEYDYDYENLVDFSFLRDKNGEFTLNITANGEEMATVKGTLKYDDKSFEFAVDSIEAGGEDLDVKFSLSVKLGGKVEKAPAYKNIITMSEGDWTELTEAIGNSTVIAELAQLFADMNTGDEYYDDDYYYPDEDYYYDEDEYYEDYHYDNMYEY